jgi:hypothetical protein
MSDTRRPALLYNDFRPDKQRLFPTHHRGEKGFRSHEGSRFWRTADRIYAPHLNLKIYLVLKIKDK